MGKGTGRQGRAGFCGSGSGIFCLASAGGPAGTQGRVTLVPQMGIAGGRLGEGWPRPRAASLPQIPVSLDAHVGSALELKSPVWGRVASGRVGAALWLPSPGQWLTVQ